MRSWGAWAWLASAIACSTEPVFGTGADATSTTGPGTSAASGASTGAGGASSASGTPAGSGGSGASGAGDPGGGGAAGEGGAISGGGPATGGGGGSSCETVGCPTPADPCTAVACEAGRCVETARPGGAEVDGCDGVCQTGAWAGRCGLRHFWRDLPQGSDWQSQPLSELWAEPGAPPPLGIAEAEIAVSQPRMLVFRDDGTLHERWEGTWREPVPIEARLDGFPEDARVALAVSWDPDPFSDGPETLLLTTDEDPPRALFYDLMPNGLLFLSSPAAPIENAQNGDAEAPPQHEVPYSWGFVEQRGGPGTNDWVVFWSSLEGKIYEYWGGNDDFVSSVEEAGSFLALDGARGAPAPNTTSAAWNDAGVVHLLAP